MRSTERPQPAQIWSLKSLIDHPLVGQSLRPHAPAADWHPRSQARMVRLLVSLNGRSGCAVMSFYVEISNLKAADEGTATLTYNNNPILHNLRWTEEACCDSSWEVWKLRSLTSHALRSFNFTFQFYRPVSTQDQLCENQIWIPFQ